LGERALKLAASRRPGTVCKMSGWFLSRRRSQVSQLRNNKQQEVWQISRQLFTIPIWIPSPSRPSRFEEFAVVIGRVSDRTRVCLRRHHHHTLDVIYSRSYGSPTRYSCSSRERWIRWSQNRNSDLKTRHTVIYTNVCRHTVVYAMIKKNLRRRSSCHSSLQHYEIDTQDTPSNSSSRENIHNRMMNMCRRNVKPLLAVWDYIYIRLIQITCGWHWHAATTSVMFHIASLRRRTLCIHN